MVDIHEDPINPKSERVKKYFAETARNMILQDGVECVSVRKVAAEAGYSFATIYNHFKSLDELLWYTRDLMILDIFEYIQTENQEKVKNTEDVKKLFRSFMGYFVKNPHIYRFFYFHHLKKEDKPQQPLESGPQFEEQYAETFEFLLKSGKYTVGEVNLIIKTLIYALYGLLTFHFSDYEELTVEAAYQEFDSVIEHLLKNVSGEG